MRTALLLALVPALLVAGEAFTVTPVLVTVGAPLPADLPFEVQPMGHQPGLNLTWMVKGEGIIGFKDGSLVVKTFTIPGNAGKPAECTMGSFPKATPDGRCGVFGLAAAGLPFDQAVQVRLGGTVVMLVGSGTEVVNVPALALDATAPVPAGPFTVQVGRGGGMMGGGDGIGLTLKGPLERIATLTVKAGGKELRSDSSMTMNDQRTWNYEKPAAGPLMIELKLWKGLKEVVLPFSYPAPAAAAGKGPGDAKR